MKKILITVKKFFPQGVSFWFSFLGVWLFFTGASFAIFSSLPEKEIVSPLPEKEKEGGSSTASFSGPKDQPCPLNGVRYTREEREIWEKRKPLLVMIENHRDSRPQSGLSRADIVYEAVAEGGITRFMGVFYCAAASEPPRKYDLGPVRSARTYFLDWASEYDDYPLYVHVGGAGKCSDPTVDPRAKALCQIERYGWKEKDHWSDLDQFSLSYRVCRREPERTGQTRATEHTMYCDSQALWEEAKKRGFGGWKYNFTSWSFKDDLSLEERGDQTPIKLYFWKGYRDYEVVWRYQQEKNTYQRINGGEVVNDFLTGEPIEAKVVIVQFVKETGPVDEHKHLLYQTVGRGKALVFQDGQVIKGSWEKKERKERTIFYDQKGREIKFNRGLIWLEILPHTNQVTYGSE